MKLLVFVFSLPALAQDGLSLRDAVRTALRQNPAIAASGAAVKAAESRMTQARSGALPKVNYSESYTRSDNPVFVFSSLLTQHQFGAANFDIGTLNRPGSLNNFQSQLTVDQPLYDAGQTRRAQQAAEAGRGLSTEERRRTEMQTIAGVARAYWDALLATESLQATEQAIRSAEADLKRAESVRAAGMSTDVDVLSLRVHVAGVAGQRIQRSGELDVARAALNDAMGAPLESAYRLTGALAPLDLPDMELAALEKAASDERPEARSGRLAGELARTEADSARSAMRPQVSFHGGLEADRQRFIDKGGVNWLASIGLRWNLFNGNADKARIEESAQTVERAAAEQKRVESAVRLEVRRAWSALRSAQQRIEVTRAAVAEAEESLRITQNRYAAGMATVTDLLRTETAVLDSRVLYLAAVHDQRVAAAMLELAAGRLNAGSEVLNS